MPMLISDKQYALVNAYMCGGDREVKICVIEKITYDKLHGLTIHRGGTIPESYDMKDVFTVYTEEELLRSYAQLYSLVQKVSSGTTVKELVKLIDLMKEFIGSIEGGDGDA